MKCQEIQAEEICSFFYKLFSVDKFTSIDSSLNGLQVGDVRRNVKKIGFAVSASMSSFRKAVECRCDMLFVHHGIFWGKPAKITGYMYERIKFLIENNLLLFACHLPLDSHESLSNSMGLARELGLKNVSGFAEYRGFNMGVYGVLENPMTCDEIKNKICTSVLLSEPKSILCKNPDKRNKMIGIVSGSGSNNFYEAYEMGLDVLITGDFSFNEYFPVLETDTSLMCLGHYETERYGAMLTCDYVRENTGLDTVFIEDSQYE